jgi:ATP-dependent DNA helicase RecG
LNDATVEDLLTYLPLRYEDRSHLATIKDLEAGLEATLELEVKHAGGYQVRNKHSFSKSRLFIFEVSGVDLANRSGRQVVVWWFVSGRRAYEIVQFYT